MEQLEQIDFDANPDDYEANIAIDEVLEGLLWYPNFQIGLLKKKKKGQ